MNYSRRDFGLFFPALLAAAGVAGTQAPALQSKTYSFDDLPVRTNGQNKIRAVLDGKTHEGFPVEMHITELAPGLAPHPPHHHVHEEMIMVREGTLEVTIAGRGAKLGPGSVAYVASNEEHGWRNVGTARAQYFVLALGRENAQA
jgi:quercetin dioxygenase-like cupin family protein